MSAKRPAALIFIFITLLIDVIGIGIIIPVLPALMEELTGGNSAEVTLYGGWMLIAYAIMQFLCSPIMGGLSDQFGRRPVLLASLFGFCLDYVLMAFSPTLGWLFLGRIIAGIMGASFTTAAAYIADISTPENRAQNFGIIGAAFGFGFILGPLLASFVADLGTRVPFMIAGALTFCNWLYGFFILPESLNAAHRRKFEWKRANPIGTLKNLSKYPVITGLIASLLMVYIAAHAVQSNWPYYVKEKFGWGPKMISYSLAVVGAVFVIIQGGLIRYIIPKLGQARSVYVGLGLSAIGFVLFALASQPWMMFAFTVIYCLGAIAGPALQGIISTAVPPNAQGELQGGLTSLMSVTSIIGPFVMTHLFAYFISDASPAYFPGAPMWLGAVLTIVATFMARKSLKKTLNLTKSTEPPAPSVSH